MNRFDGWFGGKRLIKGVVALVPGYNRMMRWVVDRMPDRAWVRRIPVANQDVMVHVGGQALWMVRPDRCEIAKQMFWTRGVRAPAEDAVALELFASFAPDASLVLDIGSNTGLFAMAAAKSNPGARVIGFDILPEAIELFFANIIRNDLCRIVPMLRGVGAPGAVFRAPVRVGGSALPSSLSTDTRFEAGVDVPIESLDSLLPLWDRRGKVLIKIDVEATEHDIFENGLCFLDTCQPTMICELLMRAQVARFQELLASRGYRFYVITDRGLQRRDALVPDRRYKDWLFACDDYPDGFGTLR